jgi:hypothetical protein
MSTPNVRVVVALDPAAPRDEPFEALAALLDPERIEVTALFVEDDNLARLAALPGAQEVRWGPAPRRALLDAASLQQQLARRADRVQRICEQAARRLSLRVDRFLIRRGEVLAELDLAAREAELLVVGRSLHSAASRSWLGAGPERLGSALRGERAPRGVLFVHEPWRTGTSILAVDDASRSAERAHSLAAALAETEHLPLRTLDVRGANPRPEALARACEDADARVLVLPRTIVGRGSDGSAEDLAALVAELPASVLLTR